MRRKRVATDSGRARGHGPSESSVSPAASVSKSEPETSRAELDVATRRIRSARRVCTCLLFLLAVGSVAGAAMATYVRLGSSNNSHCDTLIPQRHRMSGRLPDHRSLHRTMRQLGRADAQVTLPRREPSRLLPIPTRRRSRGEINAMRSSTTSIARRTSIACSVSLSAQARSRTSAAPTSLAPASVIPSASAALLAV